MATVVMIGACIGVAWEIFAASGVGGSADAGAGAAEFTLGTAHCAGTAVLVI